jgi:hypothetical protein
VSGTSPTLVLVLQELGKTDARSLLKTAIKELIARDVLRVETQERKGLGRRKGPKLLLRDGATSSPPSRALQVAHRLVQGAPSVVVDGRPARELTAVAKHLARSGARRQVLAAALVDLVGMGLVREEERRVLGLFRRQVAVRTPGGDALLAKDDERRRRRSSGSTDAMVLPYAVDPGPQDPHHPEGHGHRSDDPTDGAPHGAVDGSFDGAVDGSFDGALDGAFDGAFDSSFDGAFDSAFDQSFDSAFDSGYSDGGGGGGDGGGGGGDGGGGGS